MHSSRPPANREDFPRTSPTRDKSSAPEWLSRRFVKSALVFIFAVAVAFGCGGLLGCGGAAVKTNASAGKLTGPGDSHSTKDANSVSLPARLPVSAEAVKVPILMYHYVDASPPPTGPYDAGLTVLTAQFKDQMDYLEKNGYHTVTLEQIYLAMAGRAKLPSKPVALTFDDGGLDNYSVAFPILLAHHFTATFFVITGFVGRSVCVSWQDLVVMKAAGMEIDSHTVHHLDLTTLSASRLSEELSQSRAALIQNLGDTPIALAYPSGAFNERVEAAARKAGYLLAVTTQSGRTLRPASSLAWPRLRVASGLSLAGFARLVGGTVP